MKNFGLRLYRGKFPSLNLKDHFSLTYQVLYYRS